MLQRHGLLLLLALSTLLLLSPIVLASSSPFTSVARVGAPVTGAIVDPFSRTAFVAYGRIVECIDLRDGGVKWRYVMPIDVKGLAVDGLPAKHVLAYGSNYVALLDASEGKLLFSSCTRSVILHAEVGLGYTVYPAEERLIIGILDEYNTLYVYRVGEAGRLEMSGVCNFTFARRYLGISGEYVVDASHALILKPYYNSSTPNAFVYDFSFAPDQAFLKASFAVPSSRTLGFYVACSKPQPYIKYLALMVQSTLIGEQRMYFIYAARFSEALIQEGSSLDPVLAVYGDVVDVAVSPDLNYVLLACLDDNVYCLKLNPYYAMKYEYLWSLRTANAPLKLALAPEKMLLIASGSGFVQCIDYASGRACWNDMLGFPLNANATPVAVGSDGSCNYVALVLSTGSIVSAEDLVSTGEKAGLAKPIMYTLNVTVSDSFGRPIPNASVEVDVGSVHVCSALTNEYGCALAYSYAAPSTVKVYSDELGLLELGIKPLRPYQDVKLVYGDAMVGFSVSVVEPENVTIKGLIKGPAVNATVRLLPKTKYQPLYEYQVGPTGTIDPVYIRSGDYTLLVTHPFTAAYRENISFSDGEKKNITVPLLLRTGSVEFMAIDAETGAPIRSFKVTLEPLGWTESSVAEVVLEHGLNNTLVLPASWYHAIVSAKNFKPAEVTFLVNSSRKVVVELNPVMYRVLVRVTDTRGIPVSGASVRIGAYEATTNEHGEAVLVVRPGSYTLHVVASGYLEYASALNVESNITVKVTLTPATSVVKFRVIDDAGQPVVRAKATVLDFTGKVVATAEVIDGKLTLSLPSGMYTLMITAPPYEPFHTTIKVPTEKEYVLRLTRIPFTVNLVVKDELGEPVPNATVVLGKLEAKTSASGVAQFRVVAGKYRVIVRAPGYVLFNETLLIASPTVEVKVERLHYNLTIIAIDPLFQTPLPEARVSAYAIINGENVPIAVNVTVTPKNNTLNLPRAKYLVEIAAENFKPAKKTVELYKNTVLKVPLQPVLFEVKVKATTADGKPLPAKLKVVGVGLARPLEVTIPPEGEATIYLRAGTYYVTISYPGYRTYEVDIIVPRDRTINATLEPTLLSVILEYLPYIAGAVAVVVGVYIVLKIKERILSKLLVAEEEEYF